MAPILGYSCHSPPFHSFVLASLSLCLACCTLVLKATLLKSVPSSRLLQALEPRSPPIPFPEMLRQCLGTQFVQHLFSHPEHQFALMTISINWHWLSREHIVTRDLHLVTKNLATKVTRSLWHLAHSRRSPWTLLTCHWPNTVSLL